MSRIVAAVVKKATYHNDADSVRLYDEHGGHATSLLFKNVQSANIVGDTVNIVYKTEHGLILEIWNVQNYHNMYQMSTTIIG